MDTSIIVCTYNRAHLLKRLLSAISHQSLDPEKYEVIVVDDGSTDKTHSVCTDMMQKIKNLKYISTGKNLGLAGAQNSAINSSQGKYLLFTDDDCIPEKDWAEQLLSTLKLEPIVAGSVHTIRAEFLKTCHNIAEFHPFLPGRRAGYIDFIAGANMGIQRSVLENLGGFYTGLKCSQDMEFVLRARRNGYNIYFEPRAMVTHDPMRSSFAGIMRYAASHASTTILLRNKYREIMQTPFLLKVPALILAASPVIAFKVTAGIYLGNRMLLSYLKAFPIIFMLKLAWCWGAAYGLQKNRKALSFNE